MIYIATIGNETTNSFDDVERTSSQVWNAYFSEILWDICVHKAKQGNGKVSWEKEVEESPTTHTKNYTTGEEGGGVGGGKGEEKQARNSKEK